MMYQQPMFSTALGRRMVVQLTQLEFMHYYYPLNNTKERPNNLVDICFKLLKWKSIASCFWYRGRTLNINQFYVLLAYGIEVEL